MTWLLPKVDVRQLRGNVVDHVCKDDEENAGKRGKASRVRIDDIEYESIRHAANRLGKSVGAIRLWLLEGKAERVYEEI